MLSNIKLFDYKNAKGKNIMQAWANDISLDKRERARLDSKIDMLSIAGADLPPGLLQNTKNKHILEIAVNGKRALRPMLCRGPFNMKNEFTFLFGSIEKDRKYKPPNSPNKANNNRELLINGEGIRCEHERFKGKPDK